MAGTVTQVWNELGLMKSVVCTCTADAAAATIPATALTKGKLDGYLIAIETNPSGVTAPTNNYDITLVDGDGVDVLFGVGANRATATSEFAAIVQGTYFHAPVTPDGTYTLTIANNAVNSAITVVTIFYSGSSG